MAVCTTTLRPCITVERNSKKGKKERKKFKKKKRETRVFRSIVKVAKRARTKTDEERGVIHRYKISRVMNER